MGIEIWLLFGLALLLSAAAALILMGRQAKKLAVRRIDFSQRGVQPVRCVLLSDIHISRLPIHWDYVFTKISKEQPDFILIAGDLADGRKDGQAVLDFFTVLVDYTACPIYVVYGNHDNSYLFNKEQWAKDLFTKRLEDVSSRIRILENESILFKNDERSIMICGLGDILTNETDVAAVLRQQKKEAGEKNAKLVLLSHNPDILTKLDENCADIGFFGHTHNGR